ncbi:MAG: thiamine diphosphokinase [Clostridia bacterium]|nr:thiamine diphosphokinase [Clostridia bacterium]
MHDQKTCYILGASPDIAPLPNPSTGDCVIAADGGRAAASRLGIVPELSVGDFDSLGCVPEGDGVVRLPVMKDETDSACALRMALARGCERILLFGCTGGRPDHTFANYLLLAQACLQAEVWMFGDGYAVTCLAPGKLCLSAALSGTVSVFALGEPACGVAERGLLYTLEGANLSPLDPLGVSNSLTGQEAEISLSRGRLLVFIELCGRSAEELLSHVRRER